MQPLQEGEEGEEGGEDGDGGDGDGGREKGLDKNFEEAAKKEEGGGLSVALKSLFRCTTCSSLLPPPAPLYQVCRFCQVTKFTLSYYSLPSPYIVI